MRQCTVPNRPPTLRPTLPLPFLRRSRDGNAHNGMCTPWNEMHTMKFSHDGTVINPTPPITYNSPPYGVALCICSCSCKNRVPESQPTGKRFTVRPANKKKKKFCGMYNTVRSPELQKPIMPFKNSRVSKYEYYLSSLLTEKKKKISKFNCII